MSLIPRDSAPGATIISLSESSYGPRSPKNGEGVAVLLVEQNVVMAMRVSHRAYVLEEGCIVAEGDPATLLARPEIQRAYLGL